MKRHRVATQWLHGAISGLMVGQVAGEKRKGKRMPKARLNKTFVDGAKHMGVGNFTVYRDTELPGLGLRVTARPAVGRGDGLRPLAAPRSGGHETPQGLRRDRARHPPRASEAGRQAGDG